MSPIAKPNDIAAEFKAIIKKGESGGIHRPLRLYAVSVGPRYDTDSSMEYQKGKKKTKVKREKRKAANLGDSELPASSRGLGVMRK